MSRVAKRLLWHVVIVAVLSNFQRHNLLVTCQDIPQCAPTRFADLLRSTCPTTAVRDGTDLCENLALMRSVDGYIKSKCQDNNRDSATALISPRQILAAAPAEPTTTTGRPIVTETVVVYPTPTSVVNANSDGTSTTSPLALSTPATALPLTIISTSQSTARAATFLPSTLTQMVPISSSSTVESTSQSVTQSDSATTMQTSHQMKKTLVPIIAGAIGVLISGAFVGLYVLRRKRIRSKKQEAIISHTTPYVVHVSNDRESPEGNQLDISLESSRIDEGGNLLSHPSNPFVKSGVELTQVSAGGGGKETVVSMRHVTEIREEMARLKQLLVEAQRSSISQYPSSDQTTQLSEMREEIQRLRHLVSLQSADRWDNPDGASRTTSPPAYECL